MSESSQTRVKKVILVISQEHCRRRALLTRHKLYTSIKYNNFVLYREQPNRVATSAAINVMLANRLCFLLSPCTAVGKLYVTLQYS